MPITWCDAALEPSGAASLLSRYWSILTRVPAPLPGAGHLGSKERLPRRLSRHSLRRAAHFAALVSSSPARKICNARLRERLATR